jgi:acetylornithine/succinyldiaminopimelate/putrescine aminotransferase
MSRAVGEAMQPGTHGSTFAGGALACRAGLVFMDELEKHGLQARVRQAGARLRQGLEALVRTHAIAESARGYGLMQALVLKSESAPVAKDLLAQGLLASATGKVVLRFLPPYVITDGELDQGLAILDRVLSQRSAAGKE